MKARLPCRVFVIVRICVCVWVYTQKHIHVCLCFLCASYQEHAWDRADKNTHLVPFRMPGIFLPARFRLLPEPPCWLRRRADKLCRSTQCLAYSTLEGCRLTRSRGEAEFTGGALGVDGPGARYANLLLHNHCRPLLTICGVGVDPQGRAR